MAIAYLCHVAGHVWEARGRVYDKYSSFEEASKRQNCPDDLALIPEIEKGRLSDCQRYRELMNSITPLKVFEETCTIIYEHDFQWVIVGASSGVVALFVLNVAWAWGPSVLLALIRTWSKTA